MGALQRFREMGEPREESRESVQQPAVLAGVPPLDQSRLYGWAAVRRGTDRVRPRGQQTCQAGCTPGGPGNSWEVSALGNPEGARGWGPQFGRRAPRQTGKNEVEGWLGVCVQEEFKTQLSTHWADSNECPAGGFSSQELDKREEKVGMYPRLSALARLNHFAVTELRGSDESYKPSPLKNTRTHDLTKPAYSFGVKGPPKAIHGLSRGE